MSSLSALTNRLCIRCSPDHEVLHDGLRCVLCGYEPNKPRKRAAAAEAALRREQHTMAARAPRENDTRLLPPTKREQPENVFKRNRAKLLDAVARLRTAEATNGTDANP